MGAMEASLQSLSARLRTREEEVAALKNTVQRECQERMSLVAELISLRRGGEGQEDLEMTASDRAPSCPPDVFMRHKSPEELKGWGLLPNIARGSCAVFVHLVQGFGFRV
jgi:hypothetical protein